MGLKIIVIDDEECIRDSLKWYLEEKGHEVTTAAEPIHCDIYNGHSCSKDEPCGDLLITDFSMPRMSGLDFIELMALRGCKAPPENKIIISGDTSSINMEKVKELGCTVVQKPLRFHDLDEIILQVEKRQEK